MDGLYDIIALILGFITKEEDKEYMVLFINACVRQDSRTKRLADKLLADLQGPVTELRLWDMEFPVVDEDFLKKRDQLINNEMFSDPMFDLARQFAASDEIVIAAPYWDLSFPSSLKQYLEQICVLGVTFIYGPDGTPKGLCRAKKLTYLTTAGGDFCPLEFGFGYVEALSKMFFGIEETRLIKATGLDIVGADVEEIMSAVEEGIHG